MRRVLPLVALVGCERFLRLDQVSPAPDATIDGAPDAPPACVMPFVHDSFDGSAGDTPCSTWAIVENDASGTMTSVDGRLVIQPTAAGNSSNSHGGCLTLDSVSYTEGFFVQVTQLPAPYEYQDARLIWSGSDVQDIAWSSASVQFMHGPVMTSIPYDPMTTSWVRLHVLADSTSVEVSGDGLSWVPFVVDPVPPPAAARIELVGGVFGSNAAPAPIYFDGMNVCP